MADVLPKTLERLKNKSALILERYHILEAENQKAAQEIDRLNKAVVAQKVTIERLQKEIEFLKLATTVVPDREQLENTRATIRKLIQDIDRCIKDLTD